MGDRMPKVYVGITDREARALELFLERDRASLGFDDLAALRRLRLRLRRALIRKGWR